MPNPEWPLKVVPRLIKAIWNRSGDLVICVSGDEGVGKSTLAYHVATQTQNDFNIRKQIAYFASDAKKLLLHAPTNSVVWMDENPFYKRNFMNKDSKACNEIMMRVRYLRRLYIICTPRLGDLDEYFRNHRVKMWIRVLDRGYAEVFFPRKKEKDDPWNLDDEKKMNRINRRAHIRFGPMIPEDEEIYDNEKNKGFRELKRRHSDKEPVEKEKSNARLNIDYVNKLTNYYRESDKRICEILGINYNSFRVMKSNFKSN